MPDWEFCVPTYEAGWMEFVHDGDPHDWQALAGFYEGMRDRQGDWLILDYMEHWGTKGNV